MKVGIIGGGLTGLTIGYLLNKKGIDFEVLEKESSCGGLMRTLKEEGFAFDFCGSHIIFSKDTSTLNFMLGLLGHNKLRKRRNTKVLYKGHYVKYPFENGLADLPKEENFECIFSFFQNLLHNEKNRPENPANLEEWFYQKFGQGIAEKYLIPYNTKIWKYPVHEIGLDWVQRIPDPPVGDIIKSSLGIKTEGYLHQMHFYYPIHDGIEALIKSLEKQISKNVIRNFEVTNLQRKNGKWVASNGNESKSFDKLVSTIPLQNLCKIVNAPSDVIDTSKKLQYNSLITVMIGTNTDKSKGMSWLYIPDTKILTHRISFPSNFSPEVVPKGKSSVLAEITCRLNDTIWNMKDDDLKSRVINDLQELKILDEKDICFSALKRTEYAYVINDLDYENNRRFVKRYFDKEGINLVGRFAEFKYLNMDNCIENAMNYLGNLQVQNHT